MRLKKSLACQTLGNECQTLAQVCLYIYLRKLITDF